MRTDCFATVVIQRIVLRIMPALVLTIPSTIVRPIQAQTKESPAKTQSTRSLDLMLLPGRSSRTQTVPLVQTPSTPDLSSLCGAWNVSNPISPNTAFAATATSNGLSAYVAGGFSRDPGTGDLNQFRRYDLASKSWTSLAPMSDAPTWASAVYSPIDNKVYVFGGVLASGSAHFSLTRIYDIKTDSWSTGASMPAVRAHMASGYYAGKIYLITGTSDTAIESQVWEYDPIANSWNTSRLAIPQAVSAPGFGIVNGHFYVASGFTGGVGTYNRLYDYDIAANTWTQRASVLTAVVGPGCAVVDGQLWLFGGGTNGDINNTSTASQFYDPASDTWSSASPLNVSRSAIAGTAIGNTLFAAGGYDGVSTLNTVETSGCTTIISGGSAILSAGDAGVLKPGDTVTLAFGIQNVDTDGSCTSANFTATLQSTGGVTNPTPDAQNYGAICGGDPVVWRHFTFTVSPDLACGDPVNAALGLSDGTSSYFTLTYQFQTGIPFVAFTEKFDGVTAPALPAGWTATNAQGPPPRWVTSTIFPDTAPNSAFVDEPAVVSDKALDTPAVAIASASAQLSFRHDSELEADYDGGVLEVSAPNINGGAFTDITDTGVGGTFVTGGYSSIISSKFGNPIAGRWAWSGSFVGGYQNTVVRLGPNVAGQTIKLRFRMGSDSSSNGPGWVIDSLAISDAICAPNLLVTTVDDHNDGTCSALDCTLREAITVANTRIFSVIGFAPGVTGTIQLASALPSLNTIVAVQGPGANLLTVRRSTGGSYRVFNVLSAAVANVSGITISNGLATNVDGGGIFNSGNLTLTGCSVAGCTATASGSVGGNGGGIYNATGATLTLVRSTFVNNSAAQFGGAIYNDAIFSATNCTFSNNAALRGGAIISRFAGGVSSSILRSCTIASCTATSTSGGSSDGGGGFYAEGGAQQIHIGNSIIANNANVINPDVRGSYTSEGSNIIGSIGNAVGFANGVNGDHVGTNGSPLDPQIGPLAFNGGTTQTRALLVDGPAIDAGNDFLAPSTDQRRYLRSGVADIGAFEFGGTAPPIFLAGTISYCSKPVPGPVPNATLTLTGAPSASTLSDSFGHYTFSSLISGGNYAVTPTAPAHSPASAGINTIDVLATQRHFLFLGTPLSGCRLTAADVNADTNVNTIDVLAIQRFFLGTPTGTANVGKYQFTPASRNYSGLLISQTAQNYDALIFGDVASPFAD